MNTEKTYLCKHCITYLKAQGYTLFVGDEVDEDEVIEKGIKCDWCEDEDDVLYEVIW